MRSRIHSILPRVAVALALPGLVLLVAGYLWYTRPYAVPSDTDIFSVVEGRWAWTTRTNACAHEWHHISFTADRTVMTIANSEPYEGADGTLDSVAVYDILAHAPGWIRGAIRGETRLTADGRPVVWDLVLRAPDRYAWHRTDWIRGGYTPAVERCPDAP